MCQRDYAASDGFIRRAHLREVQDIKLICQPVATTLPIGDIRQVTAVQGHHARTKLAPGSPCTMSPTCQVLCNEADGPCGVNILDATRLVLCEAGTPCAQTMSHGNEAIALLMDVRLATWHFSL